MNLGLQEMWSRDTPVLSHLCVCGEERLFVCLFGGPGSGVAGGRLPVSGEETVTSSLHLGHQGVCASKGVQMVCFCKHTAPVTCHGVQTDRTITL